MTKDEFILKAVLAQMSPLMLIDDHSHTKDLIINNAKRMADTLEKEHIFDQESTNDILVDIRNLISDETCN